MMDKFEQVKQRILEFAYQKDFVAAERELNKAIKDYPNNAELFGMVAGLYIENGDYSQAEAFARQATRGNAPEGP